MAATYTNVDFNMFARSNYVNPSLRFGLAMRNNISLSPGTNNSTNIASQWKSAVELPAGGTTITTGMWNGWITTNSGETITWTRNGDDIDVTVAW